ncbi:MAG: AMP-binding protein [Ornithinimicrobium sp.]
MLQPPQSPEPGQTTIDRNQLSSAQLLSWVSKTLAAGEPFVVPTSGSTGSPKSVVLSAEALRFSARAVADRLGGHGHWLVALSPSYIGGLGVYVRSVLAGTTPLVLPEGPFRWQALAEAAAGMRTDLPRYVSLVPTQVSRLVAQPEGLEALRSFDRVLIGGDHLPPTLAAALTQAGVGWTHTYGMSETSGGCLHDGIAPRDVQVRLDDRKNETQTQTQTRGGVGRLLLAGPMLADGYLDRPDLDALAFRRHGGERWFATSDVGRLDAAHGRWVIVGRVDDVIITGGHKVAPTSVQDALGNLPGIAEAAVVGIPDSQWGQAVAALIVPSSESASAPLHSDPRRWVRAELRGHLPRHAIPWQVRVSDHLPRLPGGKIDYRGVKTAFLQEGGRI